MFLWSDRDGNFGADSDLSIAKHDADTDRTGFDRTKQPGSGRVYRLVEHDLERIHPPESDDERAERHERLAIQHWQEFTRLTGREPERSAPTLTAEDLRELQRALDTWRKAAEQIQIDGYASGHNAGRSAGIRVMNILDRLDAEGKLGRSGR